MSSLGKEDERMGMMILSSSSADMEKDRSDSMMSVGVEASRFNSTLTAMGGAEAVITSPGTAWRREVSISFSTSGSNFNECILHLVPLTM